MDQVMLIVCVLTMIFMILLCGYVIYSIMVDFEQYNLFVVIVAFSAVIPLGFISAWMINDVVRNEWLK